MSQRERRILLAARLVEWQNDGGCVEDVVWAIQELVEQLILDTRNGDVFERVQTTASSETKKPLSGP